MRHGDTFASKYLIVFFAKIVRMDIVMISADRAADMMMSA